MTKSRDKPTAARRKHLLEIYDNSCFYCFNEFGTWAVSKDGKKMFVLEVEWDHVIPYSFTQGRECGFEGKDNFVPACRICNRYKSGKFWGHKRLNEVRRILRRKIKAAGWTFVPV